MTFLGSPLKFNSSFLESNISKPCTLRASSQAKGPTMSSCSLIIFIIIFGKETVVSINLLISFQFIKTKNPKRKQKGSESQNQISKISIIISAHRWNRSVRENGIRYEHNTKTS